MFLLEKVPFYAAIQSKGDQIGVVVSCPFYSISCGVQDENDLADSGRFRQI